jgi:dipeptidyl aminopeptidase/acylaminoacyl peptidase
VRVVHYTSQGRQLLAWLAKPAGNGPHPAVLWAHGGWALGGGDFDDVKPFVDAGYVVLLPAWRGENGNPGDFEMLFGEVDDAEAALNYLANLPGVDRSRLYAGGHSAGATLVMLLAERSPLLRRAAACGGLPDMAAVVAATREPPFDGTPFDWSNAKECELRSPARFVGDLHCPLALFYGEDETVYRAQAEHMKRLATQAGKAVTVKWFPGTDHFSALPQAVTEMIAQFH